MTASRWIHIILISLLAIISVADGAMMLHLKLVANRTHESDTLVRFTGKVASIPPPDGFAANNTSVRVVPENHAGWVVRFAAKGCGYCKADNKRWEPLAAELRRLGYQIIVVLPSAKDEFPAGDVTPKDAPQEAFVSMEWNRRFFLTVTPTLFIFGPDQRLIWSNEGTLRSTDSKSALQAVQTAARRVE